jgi:transcription termination/antitermination protein NusG
MPDSTTKKSRWYIIYVNSGQENKVADLINLRAENTGISEFIEEVLVPTQEKIAIKKGEKKTVTEKMYQGYVFVKMVLNDATWPLVRDTQGVIKFAGTGTEPTPVPEYEVEAIKELTKEKQSSYKLDIIEGDKVKITSGDFKDFTGTVAEIDRDKGKVKVMVIMFSQERPIELDVTSIVPEK